MSELSREAVLARSRELPVFPRVIAEILSTLDDPDASLKLLADHIQHDPVVAGRILGQANAAACRVHQGSSVRDVYTATSLIGLARVRTLALSACVAGFVDDIGPPAMSRDFWRHSLAVGIACEEISRHVQCKLPVDLALVTGLLHDVGQLWLARFEPAGFSAAWEDAQAQAKSIDAAEAVRFGHDHAVIGAWLAEDWRLPSPVVAAIRGHHEPAVGTPAPLTAVVHVAEVVSNALELTPRRGNHVHTLSADACNALGLCWDASVQPLFGRIDARSRQGMGMYQ